MVVEGGWAEKKKCSLKINLPIHFDFRHRLISNITAHFCFCIKTFVFAVYVSGAFVLICSVPHIHGCRQFQAHWVVGINFL